MTSWKIKQYTELRYDDNTNIDGTPVTVLVGKESKVLDLKKGTIAVVDKDKVPSNTGTTYNTAHFVKSAANIVALVNDIQFFGVLQADIKGYKIAQNNNESKECSVQFYGGRNIDVHPEAVSKQIVIGAQMYMYPHLMDKQPPNLQNVYEFLAVNYEILDKLATQDGVTLSDELLARLYIGRADMGKYANYVNIPVDIAPASY